MTYFCAIASPRPRTSIKKRCLYGRKEVFNPVTMKFTLYSIEILKILLNYCPGEAHCTLAMRIKTQCTTWTSSSILSLLGFRNLRQRAEVPTLQGHARTPLDSFRTRSPRLASVPGRSPIPLSVYVRGYAIRTHVVCTWVCWVGGGSMQVRR